MAQLLVKPKVQFFDSNGDPLANGKVYTYEAGTTTPLATYTDKSGGTPNANPVILDSRGEASIWLADDNYKIKLTDSTDAEIYTVDNVKSINDGSISTAMLADGAVATAKLADGAVTAAKLGTGFYGLGESTEKLADYTATVNDDIILVNGIAQNVTISMPAASVGVDKVITVKRIDDTDIQTDTFVDGDVTVGTDIINVGSHPFTTLQRVQLTTSGTLPTGLATSTNYWVIYVDANNIKLASSLANAQAGTAVDITAASGGGTHTITSQRNTVTVDAYLSETIDGNTQFTLERQNEASRLYCDGTEWFSVAHNFKVPQAVYLGAESDGTKIINTNGNILQYIGNVSKNFDIYHNGALSFRVDNAGLDGTYLTNSTVTYEKLETLNYSISSGTSIAAITATSGHPNVSGMSVSITTHGRPVLLMIVPKDTNQAAMAHTSGQLDLMFRRDSTDLRLTLGASNSAANSNGPFYCFDFPSANTYTYYVGADVTTGTGYIYYCRLLAIEL